MEKRLIILLLVPLTVFWHWFEPVARKNQKGIEAFQDERYQEALREFLSAKGLDPDLPELKNNTAAALFQLGKYREALEEFSRIEPENTRIPKSDFLYNLGNTYFRLNEFEKALESYKNSLLANPGDLDSKKNYELTLKKIQEKKDKQKNQDDRNEREKEKQKEQQTQKPQPEKKYQDLMQYLNQNEKKEMEKQKRAIGVAKKEKDW